MSFLAEHAVAGAPTVYANIAARHQQRHQKAGTARFFSRAKPKASRMPSKELDASSLVTKTDLELALAQNDNDDCNVDDGSIARAVCACRRPHPVLQIVPNSDSFYDDI
jgi:hypothetical protein